MAVARDMVPAFWEMIRGRPKVIQEMSLKYPPELLYVESTRGFKCLIEDYNEDGTVDVFIHMVFNDDIDKNWIISNIDPKTLTECDIPDCCEPVD